MTKGSAVDRYAYDFIDIPERAGKPRTRGLTLVRDPGMGLTSQRIFLEDAGEFVDYVKFRNVTPRLFRESLIREKIRLYRDYGVGAMSGGIFFQFAWRQKKLEQYFSYVQEIGFSAVEIGYSMLDIPLQDKIDAIVKLHERGVNVIYEWGKKFPAGAADADHSAKEIQRIIDSGASYVVMEGGEIQQFLDKGDDAAKPLIDLVREIGADKILFEIDTDPHIAWVLKHFGADANIGPNLPPDKVLWLEPMRRGLGKQVRYSVFDTKG